MTTPPKNILIMPAAGLGDLIMAAPVIGAIKKRYPDSYIAVLAHKARGTAEIANCIPVIDELIDFPLKKYSWPAVINLFASSYWPMLADLRKKNFDTVIILNKNPIRTIITKMLRPKNLLSVKEFGHPTKLGLELIKQLDCSSEPFDFDFNFNLPVVSLDDILPENLPRPVIGIHPFSAMSWRHWNGFDALIEKLKSLNATIITLGKNADYKPVAGTVDLVNKLSVTELISVIAKLDILISTDSGPMHIGFAVDTPTVGLFGTVSPEVRMPLTKREKHIAIFHGDANEYAGKPVKERKPKKTNNLNLITADEVYQCVEKLVDQKLMK